MSHAQNHRLPSHEDDSDTSSETEYHTLRGCLTLTALVIVCGFVAVIFLIAFGTPTG